MRPTCKLFKFDVLNTVPQPNAHDCGVFALAACATDIAHGRDPVLSVWDSVSMRRHNIVDCLEAGHISLFPVKKNMKNSTWKSCTTND